MVRIRFSVWLFSGYAHVFVLVSVVIVALRMCNQRSIKISLLNTTKHFE